MTWKAWTCLVTALGWAYATTGWSGANARAQAYTDSLLVLRDSLAWAAVPVPPVPVRYSTVRHVAAAAPVAPRVADHWETITGHPDATSLALVADSFSVPRIIMWAVAYEETRHNLNPAVRSVKGAWGRMQIMPATAAHYCPGLNIRTYDENLRCSAIILSAHRQELGSWERAVYRYQGRGPIAVEYTKHVFARAGVYAVRLEEAP